MTSGKIWLTVIMLWLPSCVAEEEGLRRTPEGTGPRVDFDLDARPIPEIPFPNDIATRPDVSSPTGRRLNVSLQAVTRLEERVRRKINQLDGFGTYSPITVSFDKPLDIENLRRRQGPGSDPNRFADDAVLLIDIDPRSPHFGRAVDLDLGNGRFPLVLEKENNYFLNDPRSGISNLVYDTTDEDLNRNGLLDEGEDSDDDGVLDQPNLYPAGTDQYRDLLDFYERQTNTLVIRPLVPLRQGTEYAVVLTDRLVGDDGSPVRSPFAYVHHLSQRESLSRLEKVFAEHRPEYDLSLDNIAFAWTFTTQTATSELAQIREGLYGRGPYTGLDREFPAAVKALLPLYDETYKNRYVLKAQEMLSLIGVLVEMLTGWSREEYQPLLDTYKNVDYVVMGSLESPNFLDNAEEVFELDPRTGLNGYGRHQVYFTLVIPKETPLHKPPFPVAFYSHGYTGSRLEVFAFAGALARFGLATMAIDAYGHGTVIKLTPQQEEDIKALVEPLHLLPFWQALRTGRARDLDCDGVADSGGDFWTADTFHTRDVVRQSIVDYVSAIRMLRGFDGEHLWDEDVDQNGQKELAGDFNADGVVDVGGEKNSYFITGISLGGILSMIVPAVEPAVVAAAPVAGGGGLADIGIRSTQGGVVEAVFLKILGPLVVGVPDGQGGVVPSFNVYRVNRRVVAPFARARRIEPGMRLRLTNLRNGEWREVRAREEGRFRLTVPADWGRDRFACRADHPEDAGEPGDRLRLEIFSADGRLVEVIEKFELEQPWVFYGRSYQNGDPLVSPVEGFGHLRATPELRRFMSFAQMILERGDPINYAPHYFLEPLYPDALSRVLLIGTVGDMNVPINTAVAQGRAAGLIPYALDDARYGKPADQVLVENFVLEGLEKLRRFADDPRFHDDREILLDPDVLSEGGDGFDAPRLNPPLRLKTEHLAGGQPVGVSGVRFPYLNPRGQHGFDIPHPAKAFDMDSYLINLIGYYFARGGTVILDDVCLEDLSCSFFEEEFPAHP